MYRAGALGDTLLLVPVLRRLRARFPSSTITLVARGAPAWFLTDIGLVDRYRGVDDPRLAPLATGTEPNDDLLAALGEPDLAIIYTRRTEAAASVLSACSVRGIVSDPNPCGVTHAAATLLECLVPLGIRAELNPEEVPPLRVPFDESLMKDNPAGAALEAEGGSRVLLHPGAGSKDKRAPAAFITSIAHRLGEVGNVVLVEGPDDREAVSELSWDGPILRSLDLITLARLFGSAAAYIGHDSGVTHLSGLMGAPTLAIFGPTNPNQWRPLGPNVQVLRCPTGWTERDATRAAEAAKEMLATSFC